MISSKDHAALRRCLLFSSLPESDIHRLASASSCIQYRKRQQIFGMGEDADGLRIILSGAVRVWISDTEGHELTVNLLEQGDSFGEIALFDGQPRTATATVQELTRCLFVPRAAVDALLENNSAFAREVIHLLCETLRRNTDEMGSITFDSLERRLAQKPRSLAISHAVIDGNSARFASKFSQSELAKMLGVTREAINKRMTEFAKEKLVNVEDGYLTLHDLERLVSRKRR